MRSRVVPVAMFAVALAAIVPASASTLSVDSMGQFTDPSVSGTFRDVFAFSLTEPGVVNATYSGAPSTLQVADFGIYSGDTEQTTFQSYAFFNNVAGGTNSVQLDPGNYTVQLAGTVADGTAKYNGNVYVSAVPLPSSAALFGLSILGLGGLCAIRGRRNAKGSARAI